jgi:predicted SAM-dependent methyltransferase
MLSSSLKKIPFARRVVHLVRNFFGITSEDLNIRFHKARSSKLIESYLKDSVVRKIQIGAQSNSINGWMNLDLIPKSINVVYMDATKTFPFPSDSIDYIYTEHMIEHITFQEAKFMLIECFRVLKKGGKIRISTPDLAFLIDLYRINKNDTQQNYINFSIDRYLNNQFPVEDIYVINNFFKDWSHKFIHDYKSLYFLLTTSGFDHVKKCNVMESDDLNLQNLEQHGKEIGLLFNELESIVVEATKK